jgi:PAS domain S-box-containing protein
VDVLTQAFEAAPHGVALTTANGRIVLANAELERMFGYARAELLRHHVDDLVPDRFRAGHAALRDLNPRDARPLTMGAGRELLGAHADGSEFPIEVGIGSLATADGPIVVETIVDISERKRLERLFQRTVEATPCGIVMLDAGGRIMLINPHLEAMFGYSRTELIGNGLEMLLPERLRARHAAHRESFAAAPSARSMGMGRDLMGRRKDGSEFPVEVGLKPVPNDTGDLVLAAVTDITQHVTLQRELRQANADLEEFTYAASHDLKGPLQAIADLVEWVGEDLGPDAAPAVMRNLGRIVERTRRLERVIDDLLRYARAGRASAEVVPVEPAALIADVVQLMRLPPGFRVIMHIDAQPFTAARTPLETVLRNLIGNAVQHHDLQAGSITIRVEDVGKHCVFAVIDDGPGIPAARQQRIFRMFQTLESGTHEHSGIGLALSKRLAEAHGGWIELASTDGRRGAEFRVWWPRFQWPTP